MCRLIWGEGWGATGERVGLSYLVLSRKLSGGTFSFCRCRITFTPFHPSGDTQSPQPKVPALSPVFLPFFLLPCLPLLPSSCTALTLSSLLVRVHSLLDEESLAVTLHVSRYFGSRWILLLLLDLFLFFLLLKPDGENPPTSLAAMLAVSKPQRPRSTLGKFQYVQSFV